MSARGEHKGVETLRTCYSLLSGFVSDEVAARNQVGDGAASEIDCPQPEDLLATNEEARRLVQEFDGASRPVREVVVDSRQKMVLSAQSQGFSFTTARWRCTRRRLGAMPPLVNAGRWADENNEPTNLRNSTEVRGVDGHPTERG